MMLLQRCSRWIWLAGVLALAVGGGRPVAAQDPEATAQPVADQQAAADQQQTRSADAPKTARITAIDKTQAARGERVRLTVDREAWPSTAQDVEILLGGRSIGPATSLNGQALEFIVPGCGPHYVPLDTHEVRVMYRPGEGADPVPAEVAPEAARLEILPRNGGGAPKITGVYPVPTYPEGEPVTYKLRIQGTGFAQDACDNAVSLGGEWIDDLCWKGTGCSAGILGELAASGRVIHLSNISLLDHEIRDVKVGVGKQESEPVNIRFSRVGRKAPVRLALLGVILIAAVLVLTAGKKEKIAGKSFGLASRLFLDRETDTYSLSKLQFYIWTLVGVLGYVYLAVSTWLVQGKLDFVDVPDGLPGIVMISAATSVLAQWAQSARGPKGAGDVHPSFSDLITTGGVVAPERVQFFVWTALGAIAYISLVFLRDPGTIEDLPKVPDGFLQLMGISSAGYLGGKLARKPGPVIDNITGEIGSLTLTLYGHCLSADASFFIRPVGMAPADEAESAEVSSSEPASGAEGVEVEIKPEQLDGKPEVRERDDPAGDKMLAKRLLVKIKDPVPEAWTTGKPELTIVNPDGQRATWWFEPKPKS